jgi:hypothetical protein
MKATGSHVKIPSSAAPAIKSASALQIPELELQVHHRPRTDRSLVSTRVRRARGARQEAVEDGTLGNGCTEELKPRRETASAAFAASHVSGLHRSHRSFRSCNCGLLE